MASLQQITFELRGEHIQLDSLLKACSLVSSGGEAKIIIQDGRVQVDGRDELRRSAKIRAGQVVSLQGARIKLVAEGAAPAATTDAAADQTSTDLGD
jgi:ribosome-associated protein